MKILFLNSRGHWVNGWFSNPEEQEVAAGVLRISDIEVEIIGVENIPQLEKVLDNVSPDTLIWPNAYYVDAGAGKVVWMHEYIEARQLPFVGSGAATLRTVLEKDACQTVLRENGLPIPEFTVITQENIGNIHNLIAQNIPAYPVVLKPTAESGSIGVCLARDARQAAEYAAQILEKFPHSHVIVEAFLPSDDITCGFMQLGEEVLLLPTAYIVKSVPGVSNILSRQERLTPWGGDKIQPVITDEAILSQLKTHIPSIAAVLDIQGVTRIDGRLDENGNLRFFDVNGLPNLEKSGGVMFKQCLSCFPDYDRMTAYEGFIHTIVCHTLLKYGMEVPDELRQHNLFTMESNLVVKGEAALEGVRLKAYDY